MPPILLLHLSDLHFGPHSRFQARHPRALGASFFNAVAEAQKRIAKDAELPWLAAHRIDLVVVTGDVAEAGLPEEFEQGEQFLTGLAGGIGINHDRFIFVPGNHDVNWGSCQEAFFALTKRGKLPEAEIRAALDRVKFEFYDEFLSRFYKDRDPREPLVGAAKLYRYPDLRLTVAALDSCEKESHRTEDHFGLVSQEQAQAALDALLEGEVASWLKIVAVHHNPDRATQNNLDGWRDYLKSKGAFDDALLARYESDALGLEGREHLIALVADARAQLLLHGHQHASDKLTWDWRNSGHAHLLSSGSLSLASDKLPAEEPGSARLIVLDPDAERLRAHRLVYLAWHRIEGSVETGHFAVDPSPPVDQHLDLPEGYKGTSNTPAPQTAKPSAATADSEFLARFRSAFRDLYDRWDLGSLGTIRPGGIHAAKDAQLDDMYLELRFDETYDPRKTDKGAPIRATDLLKRDRPLALCGVAGAGKTTWSRYTFRQLIDEPRALPLMIVLRDVARRWQESGCTGEKRSIEAALGDWIGGPMGLGWADRLTPFLTAEKGPRPILIVDGWDELGPLGEEFRANLMGFLRTHPRVLAVVTSRPYGEGRPSHSDSFDVHEVQPLSDADIKAMTTRYFERFSNADVRTREVERFLAALDASADARDLARTPLLLTLMLLVGESEPLPDRRHLLYEQCIKAFLHTRPATKAKDGALAGHLVWCPDEIEQRKRWVAELAYRVQTEGYKKGTRAPIVRKRSEMSGFLPAECPDSKRESFLAWLLEVAGLLVDRADGTISFTHLSFQEYLTAFHLASIATNGERRLAAFRDHLESRDWWETLRLLAAQIHDPWPATLDDVLQALLTDADPSDSALSFLGTVLADGLGGHENVTIWTRKYFPRFDPTWPDGAELCSRAWLATRQPERKRGVARALDEHAAGAKWIARKRIERFGMGWADLPSTPTRATARGVDLATREQHHTLETVAAGRLLVGSFPIWPKGSDLGNLHLWPGTRRVDGLRLQSAVVAGATRPSLVLQSREFTPARTINSSPDHAWARELADSWTKNLATEVGVDVARNLARDCARVWTREWSAFVERDLASRLHRGWANDLLRHWNSDWTREWVSDLVTWWTLEWKSELISDWTRYWSSDFGREPHWGWWRDFTLIEVASICRSGARALAAADRANRQIIESLLAEAARCSLDPTRQPAFDLSLDPPDLDPLWPALARHIARRSTPADKALLETACQTGGAGYPQPLCWGLQFIVRGDVLLDDGSIVTLDELADEAGVARLPYLEEMEDEWDWGDDDAA